MNTNANDKPTPGDIIPTLGGSPREKEGVPAFFNAEKLLVEQSRLISKVESLARENAELAAWLAALNLCDPQALKKAYRERDALEAQLTEANLRRSETVMANEHLSEQMCGMREALDKAVERYFKTIRYTFSEKDARAWLKEQIAKALSSAPTCKHKEELVQAKEKIEGLREKLTTEYKKERILAGDELAQELADQLAQVKAQLTEAKRFLFDDNTVKALKAEVKRLEGRWAESVDLVTEVEERAKIAESQLAQVREAAKDWSIKYDQFIQEQRDEAAKQKREGDMYSYNFHEGKAHGAINMDINFQHLAKVLKE